MLKAIITVGISASGKTTYANSLDKDIWVDVNRDWIRFNVVSVGANWGTYKFSKSKENQVTDIQKEMVATARSKGQNVIISDTNLNPATLKMWKDFLEGWDYGVEIMEFPVALEEAYKRDSLRANGVGHSVIYSQYQKWLAYKGRKVYKPNSALPKAAIFDVDGTLVSMQGRTPFEWDKVGTDKPREFIIEMAKAYDSLGYTIIVLSGRDSVCYDLTRNHLKVLGVPFQHLFMREEGDTRKDSVIKEELFWEFIADSYNVVACVDDRPQMIRLWHELKIPNVIAVADPYLEF